MHTCKLASTQEESRSNYREILKPTGLKALSFPLLPSPPALHFLLFFHPLLITKEWQPNLTSSNVEARTATNAQC